MAKKKKTRSKLKAIASAKREAMKETGFLTGRFHTRTADATVKQKNRRNRRDNKNILNNM